MHKYYYFQNSFDVVVDIFLKYFSQNQFSIIKFHSLISISHFEVI